MLTVSRSCLPPLSRARVLAATRTLPRTADLATVTQAVANTHQIPVATITCRHYMPTCRHADITCRHNNCKLAKLNVNKLCISERVRSGRPGVPAVLPRLGGRHGWAGGAAAAGRPA